MKNDNHIPPENNVGHNTAISVEQEGDNSLYFTHYFSNTGKSNVVNFCEELTQTKLNSVLSENEADNLDVYHSGNKNQDCIEAVVEDMHLALTEVTHELDLRQLDVFIFNLVSRPVGIVSFVMLFSYLFVQSLHSQEIRQEMWLILISWFYLCQKTPAAFSFVSQLFRPKVRVLARKQKRLHKLIAQWKKKEISEASFREQADLLSEYRN